MAAISPPDGAAPIPPSDEAAVSWVILQPEFSAQDMGAALPAMAAEERDRILEALEAMKLISSA